MTEHASLPVEDLEPPGTVAPQRIGRALPTVLPGRAGSTARPGIAISRAGSDREHEGGRSGSFRRACFPAATAADWKDWHWQIRNRVSSLGELERILVLTDAERSAITARGTQLPFAITPYYASLLDRFDGEHPLRRTVVPRPAEARVAPGESVDPLCEEAQSPVHGLVHRYPDRVLFLTTAFCSTYCRYCTRSRVVVDVGELQPDRDQWEAALDYIQRHPEIHDVLLSGGDPLTLGDDRLEWLLKRLRSIQHVEIIRLGTKVPAVLPQRITPQLVWMLRRYHPLMMSLHFTHPDELTPETAKACARLADAGIPLGSQTVLLRGVNDSVDTMRRLTRGLLRLRVRPYYLYQCDPVVGTSEFRTPVSRGLEIIDGLRGHV